MKRILLVARPAAGGLRTHLITLISRIDRTRRAVSVAAPGALLAGLPADLPAHEVIPCALSAKPSLADFAAAATIRSGAGAQPETLVHAHGIRAGFVAALACGKSPRFPLIVTLHNVPPQSALSRAAIAFIRSRARILICVSTALALEAGLAPAADNSPETSLAAGVAVIPNGIDIAAYGGRDREAARREFGVTGDEIVVVSAARLSPEKGLRYLTSAARLVPEVKVLIAGDGPERGALSAALPENVRLIGRIDSVPWLLAAADIACVPSLTEGQGIFALEAMAAGLPVVASNVGGLPEMILRSARSERAPASYEPLPTSPKGEDILPLPPSEAEGETCRDAGLLVPPADSAAIAAAIRRLAGSPKMRADLGRAGRIRAEAIGDVAVMIRRIEEIYDAMQA